jgi:hypothetical protein
MILLMAKKKISVKFINEKEFELPAPNIGLWRELLKYKEAGYDLSTVEGFDATQRLLVKAYGEQFTVEEMEAADGLSLEEWIPAIVNMTEAINAIVTKKAGEIDEKN